MENIISDHGLRTPIEAYFHPNRKLLGLDRQFGQTNVEAFGGIWGIFSQFISTHLGTESPLSMLYMFVLQKKLSLYIQIPNRDLNLGRKELGI
jgi:hypothetical protein